jgi:hypothetical protein
MRFDSNRPVTWDALGHSSGTSDSRRQHYWRPNKCSHMPRLSITDRAPRRRGNDLLPSPLRDQNSLKCAAPIEVGLSSAPIFVTSAPEDTRLYTLRCWNIFARVSKGARHPDKRVQEFFNPTAVGWVGDFAGGRIKKLSRRAEINVGENRD